jgi:hypothetical protein
MDAPWLVEGRDDSPIAAAAIHDGHALRPGAALAMLLTSEERLREEDPFTGGWTSVAGTRLDRRQLALRGGPESRAREGGVPWPRGRLGSERMARRRATAGARRGVACHLRRLSPTRRDRRSRSCGAASAASWCSTCTATTTAATAPRRRPRIPEEPRGERRHRHSRPETVGSARRTASSPSCAGPASSGRPLDVRENVKFRGGNFSVLGAPRVSRQRLRARHRVQEVLHGRVDWECPSVPRWTAIGALLASTIPGLLEELERLR